MTTKKSNQDGPVTLAFSYRRYSSLNQSDTSLERQGKDNLKICVEHGWTLVDLPPDRAVSAWHGVNRITGVLGSFIKRVKAGQVPKGSVVIIEQLDRFGRDEVDIVLNDFCNLLRADIRIYSHIDHKIYTRESIKDKADMLMAVLGFLTANDYSQKLSERIKGNFALILERAANGEPVKLGWWQPRWINCKEVMKGVYQFEPNAHAQTINRIVTEYLDGQSMYQIARGLIAYKVPCLLNGKWSQGTVANFLRHPALLGSVTIKGITLKSYYPPVITPKQYDRLQAKLAENRSKKGGGAGSDIVANLFRNRCKCATCNATITTAKSSSDRIYTCKGKRVEKCASKYSIRVSRLETDFFQHVLQQSPADLLHAHNTEHQDKLAAIQSRIAKLDATIKDTTDLIGSVPVEELKAKLLRLSNERQAAKTELDKLNLSVIGAGGVPAALEEIKAVFLKKYAPRTLSHPEQNKELRQRLGDAAVFNVISKALKDNVTRHRLLTLLPSIVKGLVIDTTKNRYAVVFHNGTQSDWRSVAV